MDDELDTTGQAADTSAAPTLEAQLEDAIGVTEDPATGAPAVADKPAAEAGGPAAGATDPAAAPQVPADPATKPTVDPAAELYAPLPEHNPRRTHERFAKLIEGHKALDAEVKELKPLAEKAQALEAKVQEHEQGWKVFQDMGFTNDEAVSDLVQFSQYRQALGTGNWDAAAALLQEQARQLSLLSGRRIDVNPLARFPDLNERLTAGQLDEASALELARSRHVQGLQQQAAQRQQAERTQSQQQVQAVHDGAIAVDRLVSDLMRDPDYAKVEPELLKQLPAIKANYPPAMWPQEIKRAYDTEARFLRLSAQQAAPSPTPLRGNGHVGGRPAPTSMQDAVLQDLGLS